MERANKKTEQPSGEKPQDLKIGMRPSGLAGGFGFHPDTIPPHRDIRTPNPSHDKPGLLGKPMVIQKIESGLRRVGLVTPGMLIPKVTQALELYQDEGRIEVTSDEIRRKIRQQHPTKGWFPIANGNLSVTLSQMEEKGRITSKVTRHEDKTGRVKNRLVYSIAGKPQ